MRIAHHITGLAIVASALFPASASAMDILKFDTMSGNGSLFERISNGTIEPRVRKVHTNVDGKLDDTGYAKNMNELWQYGKSFACKAKLDASVCRTSAK